MKQSLTAAIAVVMFVGGTALSAQQAPPTPPVAAAPAKAPASPAGKWTVNLESPQGAMAVALEVKVDAANKVTGTLEGPQGATPIAGEVKDGVLGFTITVDGGMQIAFEGKINAEGKMAGTVSLGDMGTFPFTAERVKGL